MKYKDFILEKKKDIVKSYKIDKVSVEIHFHKNSYEVKLDGDKLDTFKSLKDAEQGVKDFFKLLGK